MLLCAASIHRETTFVLQSISEPMGIVFEFIPQVDRLQFLFILISSLLRGVSLQFMNLFFACLLVTLHHFENQGGRVGQEIRGHEHLSRLENTFVNLFIFEALLIA